MSSTSDQPQWESDDGVWILAGEHAGSAGTVCHVEDDTVYVEIAAGKQYDFDAFTAMVAADDLVPYVWFSAGDAERLSKVIEKFAPPGKRVRINALALANFLMRHGVTYPRAERANTLH